MKKSLIVAYLEYFFAKILFALVSVFSYKKIIKFGRYLLESILRFSPKYKKIAFINMSMAFPSIGEDEKKSVYKHMCRNLATVFVTFMFYKKLTAEYLCELIRIPDLTEIDKLLAQKKGIIGATGHFGNWELMSAWFGFNKYPIAAIWRPLDNKLLNTYVESYRKFAGIHLISKFDSSAKLISILKKGYILFVLGDQNTIRQNIFIPFLGKVASASQGIGFLHIATNAPILFMYSYFDDQNKLNAYISKPFDMETWYNSIPIERKFFFHMFNAFYNFNLDNKYTMLFSKDDLGIVINQDLHNSELSKFKQEFSQKNYNTLTKKEKIFFITILYHMHIEEALNKHKDSWMWVHPRWRHQPKGHANPYDQ